MAAEEGTPQQQLEKLLALAQFDTIEDCLKQLEVWEANPSSLSARADTLRASIAKNAAKLYHTMQRAPAVLGRAEQQARLDILLREEGYDAGQPGWQEKLEGDMRRMQSMLAGLSTDSAEASECQTGIEKLTEILSLVQALGVSRAAAPGACTTTTAAVAVGSPSLAVAGAAVSPTPHEQG